MRRPGSVFLVSPTLVIDPHDLLHLLEPAGQVVDAGGRLAVAVGAEEKDGAADLGDELAVAFQRAFDEDLTKGDAGSQFGWIHFLIVDDGTGSPFKLFPFMVF